MFDMKGFHISASGAIQGHHGPLVLNNFNSFCKEFYTCMCNITKKLSFLVKILYNVTHAKDW